MEHYICVIDSLGQCKYLQEVISMLPMILIIANKVSWMGLFLVLIPTENRGLENTCFARDIQGNSKSIIDRDTNCNLQN